MAIRIYQVDAFCKELFSGNPAAVCPLEAWPEDGLLQRIAAENNLAETAFFVRDAGTGTSGDSGLSGASAGGLGVPAGGSGASAGGTGRFHIRWFTPTVEVDLCGHATLASAHVLFEHEGFSQDKIVFTSRSGELVVTREAGLLQLNFPVDVIRRVDISDAMRHWFSAVPVDGSTQRRAPMDGSTQRRVPAVPVEAYRGRSDYMLVFDSEATIANLQPDLAAIGKVREARGVIVTAKGSVSDFVSRFFAPQSGINEDPVTGSAHTTLTPFWAERLGKKDLTAIQLSARRGFLQCRDLGERVAISGTAKTYMVGVLNLD